MAVAPGGFVAQTEGEITPAAAGTAKTILMVNAAANRSIKVDEIGIGFVGVTAGAKPVLVEVVESTAAGAGAGSSSVTPRKTENSTTVTVQATAAKGYTSEPTVLLPIREWLIHPQASGLIQLPLARELTSRVGGGIGLRVTFATAETTVNIRGYIEFEE